MPYMGVWSTQLSAVNNTLKKRNGSYIKIRILCYVHLYNNYFVNFVHRNMVLSRKEHSFIYYIPTGMDTIFKNHYITLMLKNIKLFKMCCIFMLYSCAIYGHFITM